VGSPNPNPDEAIPVRATAWTIGRFFVGIVAVSVLLSALLLAAIATLVPLALGWDPVALTSGSMAPAVDTGDVLLAAPHNGYGLGPGSIVVFADPSGNGTITHRIVAVNPDGTYTTKGDAQPRIDSTPLEPDQVIGVGRVVVAEIGSPLVWWWQGQWLQLVLFAVTAAAVMWVSRWGLLDKYDPWLEPFPVFPPWMEARWNRRRETGTQLRFRWQKDHVVRAGRWSLYNRLNLGRRPNTRAPAPARRQRLQRRRNRKQLSFRLGSLAAVLAVMMTAALLTMTAVPGAAAFSDTADNSDNNLNAAASFCTSPGSQTVYPSMDSWVDERKATFNYGSRRTMFVISSSGGSGDAGRSLVQFSLPSAPDGCTMTSATLRVFAESFQLGRTIAVYRNSGSWSEGGVTWNNMPGYTGTAVTTSSGYGWLEWTVTDHASVMYSGSNYGFLIMDYNEGDPGSNQETQRFATRESGTYPELVITWG
jgi:signal peptidase I